MAKIDLQYDLINYTPATASPVEANFNRIEQHINQEVVERGGTVAMTAQLKLVGDPVSDLDAAPKQYVDAIIPIGAMMMYGGAAVPSGGRWAFCNGAELETSAYPLLFAVLANLYSPPGTPAGRFHLPNLIDRFPIGRSTTAPIGTTGGSRDAVAVTHAHSINHSHGTVGSTNQSGDHTHIMDHYHSAISGATSVEAQGHHHAFRGAAIATAGGGLGTVAVADDSLTGFPYVANSSGQSGNHQHTLSGTTNYASQTNSAWQFTSGVTAGHSHNVDIPAYTGTSASTGVTGVDANLPPFISISYIMRVL